MWGSSLSTYVHACGFVWEAPVPPSVPYLFAHTVCSCTRTVSQAAAKSLVPVSPAGHPVHSRSQSCRTEVDKDWLSCLH